MSETVSTASEFWAELPHILDSAEELDDAAGAAALVDFLEDHRSTWCAIVASMRASADRCSSGVACSWRKGTRPMTQSQTEILAAAICSIERDGLTQSEIDAQILAIAGHLADGTCGPLIDRVAEIVQQRMAAAARQADTLAQVERLARASACPDDAPMLPWLLQHGLIEVGDDGAYRLTAKASTRAV
jgi:hypothetical protein